jgi:NAD-dependent DNA ligase
MTSVSKNTTMVVIKDHNQKTGAKVEKAYELGKEVLSVDEFKHRYSIKI